MVTVLSIVAAARVVLPRGQRRRSVLEAVCSSSVLETVRDSILLETASNSSVLEAVCSLRLAWKH
jgi:hypothetical protein